MRLSPGAAFLASCISAGCTSSLAISDYEGRYEAGGASSLLIATRPGDGALFAVVNGGRYLLRPHAPDVFLNTTGQEVHFARDRAGRVVGYRVRIKPLLADNPLHARLDAEARVPANSWHARPPGPRRAYVYAEPRASADGLATRALPAKSILKAGVSAMTEAIYDEAFPNLHSVLIYQDGALVFEEYFYGYDRDTPHQMRSATKTLMALVVGAAVDRGLIRSIDEPVLPWFGEYRELLHPDPRKSAITLRHLLTMSSDSIATIGTRSRPVTKAEWSRPTIGPDSRSTCR